MAVRLWTDDVFIIDSPKFCIGIGWDECNDYCSFIPDVSAFLIDGNRKLISDEYLVFYNTAKRVNVNDHSVVSSNLSNGHIDYHTRPVDPDLSVIGSTEFCGNESEDNEDVDTINIDLSRVNPKVQEIVITLSIYGYDTINLKFKDINRIYARYYTIGNEVDGMENCRYDLSLDYSSCASIEICRIYRYNAKWAFQALGIGHTRGLDELVEKFT